MSNDADGTDKEKAINIKCPAFADGIAIKTIKTEKKPKKL